MKNAKTLVIFILLTNIFLTGQAADSIYTLDSVVVVSSRYRQPVIEVPFSLDIVDRKLSSTAGKTESLSSILSELPGIYSLDRNNAAQGEKIAIRGIGVRSQFGIRGIKLILDGIPLSFPDGQSQLNNLDPASIDKVEIIKGPNSVLYGNASGGIIYIETRGIDEKGYKIKPELQIGSSQYRRTGFTAGGTAGSDSYTFHYSRVESDGFRNHSNSLQNKYNFIAKNKLGSSAGITSILNYSFSPYLLNPSSLNKKDAEDNPEKARSFIVGQGAGKRVEQGQAGVNFEYKPNSAQSYSSALYAVFRSLDNNIPGRIIDLNRFSAGTRNTFTYKTLLMGNELNYIGGLDFEMQNDTRIEFKNLGIDEENYPAAVKVIDAAGRGDKILEQRERVFGGGVLSKIEYRPLSNLALSAGGRYDSYLFDVEDRMSSAGINGSSSIHFDNFSHTIAVLYDLENNTSIYANSSSAFQTPTTTELSNKPDGSGGFNNLKPEKFHSLEIGIRGIFSSFNLYFNLALYRIEMEKILIPYQSEAADSEEVFYKNAGRADNNGADLLIIWEPTNKMRIDFGYTLTEFTYEDFRSEVINDGAKNIYQLAGNRVPGIPSRKASAGFDTRLPMNLEFSANFIWNSEYYCNDFNGPAPGDEGSLSEHRNDSFSELNVRIGHTIKFHNFTFKSFLGINNLLDERYSGSVIPNAAGSRYFEPAPARNIIFGVSADFSSK